MVRGVALLARVAEARLVHLARREPAQQLDQRVRRAGVDLGRGDRAELLPRVPGRAAGSQLAQPGGPRGDVRGAALLDRAGRRRVPRGRDAAGAQGPLAARQPRDAGLGRAAGRLRRAAAAVHDRPRRGAGGRRRDPRRDRRRASVHGRGDRAGRAARALLRRRRRGRAPAVQLPPDLLRLERGRGGGSDRALRGGAAAGRVAELGARQPRPAARRLARRARPGARRRDAPADAARHADAVQRRRDRHGGRRRAGRARRRPRRARPRAVADALDGRARRGVHLRRAVAPARRPRGQRRRAGGRPALDARAAPRAAGAAPLARRPADGRLRDPGRRRRARLPPRRVDRSSP